MANLSGSQRCHNQQAQWSVECNGISSYAQETVASTSQTTAQRQLRSTRSPDFSPRRAGSHRGARLQQSFSSSSSSSSSASTSTHSEGKTNPRRPRLGRALGLLCAASSLAAGFSPIHEVSARSQSMRRHAAADFEETRFPAGFARQSHEQQSRQLEQREVTRVKKVIFEASGSDVAALRTSHNSSASVSSHLSGRWGHSSTYLENEKTILFVGGQVADGSSLEYTNDVFALNVSSLVTNSTSGPQNSWSQLSSHGLEPHAFAGQAVTQTKKGADQIWLFGGYTNNCSASAAWTWTASEGMNKSWSAVGPTEGLTRKARAPTMGVPAGTGLAHGQNATGTAVMMLGGLDVTYDCSSQGNATANDDGAVVWQLGHSNLTSVREMAVKDGNGTFSLIDYSTVVVPAKGLGNSTIFFGGMTSHDVFANWTTLWSFNPWTSTWETIATTGEIPAGRRGHTSTLIGKDRVVVAGGVLANGTLTDEVFILTFNDTTAVWSTPTYAKDQTVAAPAKAYHSALLVEDVLVVGFGAARNSTTSSSASSKERRGTKTSTSTTAAAPVLYLDTSNDKAWRWSDSIEGVLEARGVVRAVTSTTSTHSSTSTSSTSSSSSRTSTRTSSSTRTTSSTRTRSSTSAASTSTPSTTTSSARPTTTNAASSTSYSAAPAVSTSADDGAGSSSSSSVEEDPTTTAAAAQATHYSASSSTRSSASASATSDGSGSATITTAAKTGAVVGSLLGAAAFAVVLGGLYAYKKRKDSYKEWAAMGRDAERRGGGGNEGGGAGDAPPVSMLWFHGGRNATREDEGSFTQQPVNRGGRPRLSDSRSPDPLLTDPFAAANDSYVARPATAVYASASHDGYLSYDPYRAPLSPFSLDVATPAQRQPLDRNQSSESLASSIGGASHCSYPYLSAMHRPSLGASQASPNPSSATVTPALSSVSPRAVMAERCAGGFLTSPTAQHPHRFSARDMVSGWDPRALQELKSARGAGVDDSFDEVTLDVEEVEDADADGSIVFKGDQDEEHEHEHELQERDERIAELGERKTHIDLRHPHLQALVTRNNGQRSYSLPHQAMPLTKTMSTSSVPGAPRTARVTSGRAKRTMLRVTNASLDAEY
ncbi:hypothetical protein BCV69DRAFT_282642 [Microstroma glucosiphilum]|uniref:Galactose oxidase n=1 Tax=Pseudomicrostroma glucosiphilum TaxID=1684307 RepID=A0A316U8G8_9BASI|nr:hypothetical protein BCV69DRAFT_282642 [Pseudomicrostroma glucosiphilum]PWN21144.1 hypothetical protein BCV69DRAFT_282642 [Pseudomicrostroma glucosiphilum]